jgi:hypothetical protein
VLCSNNWWHWTVWSRRSRCWRTTFHADASPSEMAAAGI